MQLLLLRLMYVDSRCDCYSRPYVIALMHFSVGDAVPVDVYVGPYELSKGLGLWAKVRGIAAMTRQCKAV
jgi:hypothetical protein